MIGGSAPQTFHAEKDPETKELSGDPTPPNGRVWSFERLLPYSAFKESRGGYHAYAPFERSLSWRHVFSTRGITFYRYTPYLFYCIQWFFFVVNALLARLDGDGSQGLASRPREVLEATYHVCLLLMTPGLLFPFRAPTSVLYIWLHRGWLIASLVAVTSTTGSAPEFFLVGAFIVWFSVVGIDLLTFPRRPAVRVFWTGCLKLMAFMDLALNLLLGFILALDGENEERQIFGYVIVCISLVLLLPPTVVILENDELI
uniref:Uncharacterized protein n=1 Tax=Chromera velia CCMP2878 TaxID=1169474 RepID=A0A0G4I5H3_9ALVE|eukprot:Cvel_11179.t1-p1 / transcript=Cvel_11179.t1 / gene=Cvel_11179 / organism=Chromera_velia_CCMP2878 / gene_product=hypothetical protein / transcript_product=hypothetical protein / location=Cvel_scaffold694:11442-12212(-) / protein_length=257 / sequence_SO=supercontig / SO=protein_coding / is_pseudo=false